MAPIRVTKVWMSLRRQDAWLWECSVHVRARGYHRRNRRTDWYLARMGKPPAEHPWFTCLNGAIKHYHLYHDLTKACCHKDEG